jgi:hypothetical protein
LLIRTAVSGRFLLLGKQLAHCRHHYWPAIATTLTFCQISAHDLKVPHHWLEATVCDSVRAVRLKLAGQLRVITANVIVAKAHA